MRVARVAGSIASIVASYQPLSLTPGDGNHTFNVRALDAAGNNDPTPANHAWIEGQKSTPLEMGLEWAVALDKEGYFVGRRALEKEKRDGSAWISRRS